MVIFAIAFLILLVISLLKEILSVFYIGLFVFGSVGITELFKSEFLKSEIILEAKLDDDQSAIFLKLRENQSFEINHHFIFGQDKFEGKYKIKNDSIIFSDRRDNNGFIPDNVFMIDRKIVFYKNSEPEFARFFKITFKK